MKKLLLIFILLFGFSCRTNKNSLIQKDKVKITFNIPKEDTGVSSIDSHLFKEKISVDHDGDGVPDIADVEPPKSVPVLSTDNDDRSGNPIKIRRQNASSVQEQEPVLPGVLAYHIPDTMSVFTDYTVKIRITRNNNKNKIDITSNIGGRAITEEIKTTENMYVDLIDSSPDSSFVIKKINDNEQLVDSNSFTEWVYSVRPIKNGDKKLSLVISIIKGNNKKQIVYSDTIHVKDNVIKEVKSFWGKYWQWLFTTFLIPIFVYFWKKRDKKNNS